MSGAYLISLTTDASDRVPLLRPLIYHEQGRGEVLHRRKAKIQEGRERERMGEEYSGDAEEGGPKLNKGRKNRHIEKQRAKGR